MDVLTLDGSYGEGGGQILRTALSLSAVTMRPFCLTNIRLGRRNPGILPQHLSAVRAAATISGATVSGDRLGSTELCFTPSHPPKAGSYVFDVAETAERGSAGSVSLILQTALGSPSVERSCIHIIAARRNPRGMVAILRRSRKCLFPGVASNRLSHRCRIEAVGLVSSRKWRDLLRDRN